jgi:hypothetical protein
MYYLKEETKAKLLQYKFTFVASEIGITSQKLGRIVKKNERCLRLTAYALTKFLDSSKNIEDFFIYEEE